MPTRVKSTSWLGDDTNLSVVVIHAPGAIKMPWINNSNVKAVILALFLGQKGGNTIADILLNPSGRLPFTINTKISDYLCLVLLHVRRIPFLE